MIDYLLPLMTENQTPYCNVLAIVLLLRIAIITMI